MALESTDKKLGDDSENNSKDDSSTSRRQVLQSMGAAGVLPITLPSDQEGPVSFSTDLKTEFSLDQVYDSSAIDRLKSEFPEVEINAEEVKSALTDVNGKITSINLSVPDGELTYVNTGETGHATLKVDEDIRWKFEDWPSHTDAWIRATADEAVFTRSTTAFEKFLASYELGRTNIENPTDLSVIYAPELDRYYIDKYDREAKEIESIIATTGGVSITDDSSENSLTIQSQEYYDESVSTMTGGECELSKGTAKNIFFCLQQAATCTLCAPSVVGGPQAAVACFLLVCLGSPTALQAIIPDLRNDCVVLAERAHDCYTEITDRYPVNPGPVTPVPPL